MRVKITVNENANTPSAPQSSPDAAERVIPRVCTGDASRHGVQSAARGRLLPPARRGCQHGGMDADAPDIDAYIDGFPAEIAQRMRLIRAALLDAVGPDAEERMRYGIAAVMLGGRYALHYAGWKKHIGLYPVPPLAEPLDVGADPRDDLRRAAGAGDGLAERRRAVVEQILGPFAQLHDARVARAELLRGVGDLVVVQLVQLERLTEVLTHSRHRVAKILRRVAAEFDLGVGELVVRHADPLVGRHECRPRLPAEFGILCLDLRVLALASAPETGHAPILRAGGCGGPPATS